MTPIIADLDLLRQRNKVALVQAHRSGDWEAARQLSQERNKLRKRCLQACRICGVPSHGRYCQIHNRQLLSMRSSKIKIA